MTYVVFGFFGILTLGGGILVVTSRNLVRAAASLVLSLFGVAGLYVLLEAGFLAAAQILIYIGAIAILIIFAVMLTQRVAAENRAAMNSQWPWALLVSALTFALLVYIINIVWPLGIRAANVPVLAADPTKGLGMALVDWGQYVLPFEVASILLLGAMVGSIFVAREQHDD